MICAQRSAGAARRIKTPAFPRAYRWRRRDHVYSVFPFVPQTVTWCCNMQSLVYEGGQVLPLRPGSESHTQAEKWNPKQSIGSTVRAREAWAPGAGWGPGSRSRRAVVRGERQVDSGAAGGEIFVGREAEQLGTRGGGGVCLGAQGKVRLEHRIRAGAPGGSGGRAGGKAVGSSGYRQDGAAGVGCAEGLGSGPSSVVADAACCDVCPLKRGFPCGRRRHQRAVGRGDGAGWAVSKGPGAMLATPEGSWLVPSPNVAPKSSQPKRQSAVCPPAPSCRPLPPSPPQKPVLRRRGCEGATGG